MAEENVSTQVQAITEPVALTDNIWTEDQLVEMTFGGQTTKVWPEIAEFFNSRTKAQREYEITRAERDAVVQGEVAKRRLEWLRNMDNDPRMFDQYSTQRQIERELRTADGGIDLRVAESRLLDYTEPSAMQARNRRNRNNPNAWENLKNSTTHPVVRWIVEHTTEYSHEAETILRHLPRDIESIWNVAKEDNDMCSVFDRFMEQAKRAGVLEGLDVNVPVSVKERTALRSYIRRTYGSGYTRELMPRVDRIVNAELEAARAQWQQLDEAYAENIHHNRSEGAKRAAETRRRNREEAAQTEVPEPHAAAQAAAKPAPEPEMVISFS